MKELKEKFLVLKIEERYDPFTYIWSTLSYQWRDALDEGRKLRREEAAYRIVRRYFLTAGYGRARTVARVLSNEPKLVAYTLNRLAREKLLASCEPASGLPRDCYVLSGDNPLG